MKSYKILHSEFNTTNYCVDYLIYIIILLVIIIYTIRYILVNSNNDEHFNIITTTAELNSVATLPSVSFKSSGEMNLNMQQKNNEKQPLSIEQELMEIKSINDALRKSNETLEDSIKKQSRALYLSNNYYKVDDKSFNNELNFINNDFKDIRFPPNNFENKIVISTENDLQNFISKASQYKNFYEKGDVVFKPSDFNITKDKICYRDYGNHMSNDPNFKNKYPDCMVCSVNTESDYENTNSWKNTKTNIQKVCLFNPNAPANSAILNYEGCKKLCE